MTLKQFKHAINMGLGNVILALKEMPEISEGYRDAVLYACLHNTRYDWQCESGRSLYLYEACSLVGDKNYFYNKIIEKLFKTNSLALVGQLCDLLVLLQNNVKLNIGEILKARLDEYISILPKQRSNACKTTLRESAECIAVTLCDIYGINFFVRTMDTLGHIMLQHDDDNIFSYDWLFGSAKMKFSEARVLKVLNNKAEISPGIKYILQKIKENEENRNEYREIRKKAKVSVYDLIEVVLSGKQYHILATIRNFRQNATADDLKLISERIKTETDISIRNSLLKLFTKVDYPGNIEELLTFFYKVDDLKETALAALARFKDERIHKIAVENLRNKTYIPESLDLLVKNYRNDHKLILEVIKGHKDSDGYDFHYLVMAVKDIYRAHSAKKALEILKHIYYKNRCAFCRNGIIDIMCKNKILPPEIQREAIYDCCEDTRKLVRRYTARMNKVCKSTGEIL